MGTRRGGESCHGSGCLDHRTNFTVQSWDGHPEDVEGHTATNPTSLWTLGDFRALEGLQDAKRGAISLSSRNGGYSQISGHLDEPHVLSLACVFSAHVSAIPVVRLFSRFHLVDPTSSFGRLHWNSFSPWGWAPTVFGCFFFRTLRWHLRVMESQVAHEVCLKSWECLHCRPRFCGKLQGQLVEVPKVEQRAFEQLQVVDVLAVGELKSVPQERVQQRFG